MTALQNSQRWPTRQGVFALGYCHLIAGSSVALFSLSTSTIPCLSLPIFSPASYLPAIPLGQRWQRH
ncbi:hypothetical protein B0T16DRAFT_406776 [Cercophora newfieldiana]|uniref:Uncharacterized protein n=1 Tax=Cercophora newfieldiana TaxID=92897 RepID=A0AA39YJQ1_9PEZI|nr:hypothetical protein B0T16DRAFT_406776 [Cercophora newfieldiana]